MNRNSCECTLNESLMQGTRRNTVLAGGAAGVRGEPRGVQEIGRRPHRPPLPPAPLGGCAGRTELLCFALSVELPSRSPSKPLYNTFSLHLLLWPLSPAGSAFAPPLLGFAPPHDPSSSTPVPVSVAAPVPSGPSAPLSLLDTAFAVLRPFAGREDLTLRCVAATVAAFEGCEESCMHRTESSRSV